MVCLPRLMLVAVALASFAAPVSAQDYGVYVRGALGVAQSRDVQGGLAENRGFGGDLGGAGVIEAAVGVATPFAVRVEAVLSHRQGLEGDGRTQRAGATFASKADIAATVLLAQALYDLPQVWRLKPYAGFGLGVAINSMDDVRRTLGSAAFGSVALPDEAGATTTEFAWALTGGAAIELTDGLDFDLFYRYLDAGVARSTGRDVTGLALGNRLEAKIRTHEVMAGLRWRF